MTMLSARLSLALARGRRPGAPATRSKLLEVLLRKRAAAHVTGDDALESLLRDQIRWALPMRDGAED